MAKLIESNSRTEAWHSAATTLLDESPTLNLVLSIKKPDWDGGFSNVNSIVDKFLSSEGAFSTHTLAEFIFPGYEYKKWGEKGVFETYPDNLFPVIEKLPSINWGTYAYRLVRRRTVDGNTINPLKQMIKKMNSELSKPGVKRSCYELGLSLNEFELPLYETTQDLNRRMGGPCLSHLSFKLFEQKVHLTAFYRSHDYRHRAFGNLIGLARLLTFVACQTRQEIGSLVVHSSYAYVEGGKRRLKELLSEIELARRERSYVAR